MKTFTIVGGVAYPGIFHREVRQHANLLSSFRESYLSAHGPFGSLSVAVCDEVDNEPVAEAVLRERLATEIKRKLAS